MTNGTVDQRLHTGEPQGIYDISVIYEFNLTLSFVKTWTTSSGTFAPGTTTSSIGVISIVSIRQITSIFKFDSVSLRRIIREKTVMSTQWLEAETTFVSDMHVCNGIVEMSNFMFIHQMMNVHIFNFYHALFWNDSVLVVRFTSDHCKWKLVYNSALYIYIYIL